MSVRVRDVEECIISRRQNQARRQLKMIVDLDQVFLRKSTLYN